MLWNNRLCLFHLVFMGHARGLKASEPPQRLLQGWAVPAAGALVGLRPGRCSWLKNLVSLPCSYDSQLIQKYFPAVPGKTLLVLAFFQREQCWSCREHLQERCSLSREETLSVVNDLLLTSYLCFCSTSDAIHQQECECKDTEMAIAHSSRV